MLLINCKKYIFNVYICNRCKFIVFGILVYDKEIDFLFRSGNKEIYKLFKVDSFYLKSVIIWSNG